MLSPGVGGGRVATEGCHCPPQSQDNQDKAHCPQGLFPVCRGAPDQLQGRSRRGMEHLPIGISWRMGVWSVLLCPPWLW